MTGLLTILMAFACTSSPVDPAAQALQDGTSKPAQVTDLVVTDSSGTSRTLSFTQVDDGTGHPADYAVRFQIGPIDWGSAAEVVYGSCAAPVQGTGIGARVSCTVDNLVPENTYTFQVAAFRGTFRGGAVYGALSNVVPDMEGESAPRSSGSQPNEPAGLTTMVDLSFSSAMNASTGECRFAKGQSSNETFVSDASSPMGDGMVYRLRFPKGMEDGGSPGRFDCWGPTINESGGNSYNEIYLSYWLKIEGSDYQNQSVGTKTHYVAHGSTSRSNHSTLFLAGTGSQSIMSSTTAAMYIFEDWNSDGSDPGGGSVKNNPNVTNEQIDAGSWVQVEQYMKVNTVSGSGWTADGIFRQWVDGVQTHNLTDIEWRTHVNTKGFYHFQFTPIYGGNAGEVRTRDDYWRIDGLYISGRI